MKRARRVARAVMDREVMTRPRFANGHWWYWWYEPIYRENLELIWPVTVDQHQDYVRTSAKRYGFGDVERFLTDRPFQGRTTEIDGKVARGIVVSLASWKNDAAHNGCLAHECLHVVDCILRRRRVTWDNDAEGTDNEAQAYLLEYLVTTCHRALSAPQ